MGLAGLDLIWYVGAVVLVGTVSMPCSACAGTYSWFAAQDRMWDWTAAARAKLRGARAAASARCGWGVTPRAAPAGSVHSLLTDGQAGHGSVTQVT
jgi:hypothetical protein